jgi:multidrug efflux system outer membrane protein
VSGRKLAAAATAAALMSGCAVGPNYKRPEIASPAQFYGQTGPAEERALTDAPWWQIFDDPTLRSLVDEALKNGFDARLAIARMDEARAQSGVAKSAYWPQIGYGGGATHGQASQFVNPAGGGQVNTIYSANVNLGWEIDLWGRIRRLNEAALAAYLATEEARRSVSLALVTDVADAYFELLELDEELVIAKRSAQAFQDTYDLFKRRLEGGAASALETSRAEAALDDTRAQIPDFERQIVAKENEINLLLGRAPQPIPRGAPLDAQKASPEVPVGLPSALLERRPDVRAAEQQLIAANAGIGVAVANFFPQISLTGLFGGVSDEVSQLFHTGKTWSISAGLLGPIFQGGRLKREKEVAVAQFNQAKIVYEQTVTTSFADVSTSLISRTKLAEIRVESEKTVLAYREAVRLANLRYDSGLASYFEVLDAMLELYPAEQRLARVRRDELKSVVGVYGALGGGWQVEEAESSQNAH